MSDTKPTEVATEAPQLDTQIGSEPVAATETPAAEPSSQTEAAPATTEADASQEQKAATEEPSAETKPITEGVLGYKSPGIISSLRFSKRFFWFGDEAVPADKLDLYLREEKAEIAHHNAAWSSQSGKGLLFFAKRAEDKAHPTGIINLADVSDVIKEATKEFSFRLNGHKYLFEAASTADRDGWLATFQPKIEEAKASVETITGSDGYKEQKEKLGKPVVAAAAASTTPVSKREKTPDARKDRSVSRKRGSVFGNLLGKKEEQEVKKEEAKEETKTEGEEATPETAVPATEALDANAVAARVVAEPAETVSGAAAETSEPTTAEPAATTTESAAKTEVKAETASKPNKRTSIFGSLFKKDAASPSEEKKETAPVAAKEAEEPTTEAPAAAETVAEPAATEDTAAVVEPTATTPSAETPKEKRRGSSFFGTLGSKKEKKAEGEASDAEAKQKSKLGGLFRKPSRAVKSEAESKEAASAPAATETSEEAKPTEPAVTSEKPAVSTEAPQETAVASQTPATPQVEAAA